MKLILCDIDGTLLNKERSLSPATIDAMQRVWHERTIPFILASSRMPKAMRYFLEMCGLNFPIVAFNGALIQDKIIHGKTKNLFSQTLPFQAFATIATYCVKSEIQLSVYRNDEWFAYKEDRWIEREAHNTRTMPHIIGFDMLLEMWQIKQMGPHKMMAMAQKEEIDVLDTLIRQHYHNDVVGYRSKDTYLEIAPRATNKGTALRFLAEWYGYPTAKIMAFGDNYNDIDMLALAGRSIAVANAVAEVKQATSQQTESNINDGVANYLRQFLEE